ncbi:hypothetical protein K470DRAFT_113301 [Piedraia hortae CBS 480.64]|uniref:Uncharacterized protein n=1 Tax=Piedraia hortae CBS 480.64 TaxID=1314780 RepID=A0A6A7BUZ1_9PEZI|nr:hypothetical protein K470DRAFT_113301 [Piedraia hortae CBS 480.64]
MADFIELGATGINHLCERYWDSGWDYVRDTAQGSKSKNKKGERRHRNSLPPPEKSAYSMDGSRDVTRRYDDDSDYDERDGGRYRSSGRGYRDGDYPRDVDYARDEDYGRDSGYGRSRDYYYDERDYDDRRSGRDSRRGSYSQDRGGYDVEPYSRSYSRSRDRRRSSKRSRDRSRRRKAEVLSLCIRPGVSVYGNDDRIRRVCKAVHS